MPCERGCAELGGPRKRQNNSQSYFSFILLALYCYIDHSARIYRKAIENVTKSGNFHRTTKTSSGSTRKHERGAGENVLSS